MPVCGAGASPLVWANVGFAAISPITREAKSIRFTAIFSVDSPIIPDTANRDAGMGAEGEIHSSISEECREHFWPRREPMRAARLGASSHAGSARISAASTINVQQGNDLSLVLLNPCKFELIEFYLGRLGRSGVGGQAQLEFRRWMGPVNQKSPPLAVRTDEESEPPIRLFQP